jgi:signal transduction histidine kinase
LPVEKLLGPEFARNVKHELSKQDRVQFFDMSFESPGGKKLILNVSALNMRYENKTEIVIIFQDITEKKMIDDHLQRLDKLASIGTIAAGMAHEIRSPLTSISMDLDSLYESAFKKEEVQKTIVQVLNEIERVDKIVSNLLQFSRPASREFVRFELR